jgi:hypothetical protein
LPIKDVSETRLIFSFRKRIERKTQLPPILAATEQQYNNTPTQQHNNTPTNTINMEVPNETKTPDFEVVGLHHNTEGRACCIHSHCGKHVQENDVLRLVHFVAQIREHADPEDAIKLVKIVHGTETCTVGFVPRSFARLKKMKDRIGDFCVVVQLYDKSDNIYERRLLEKNYGMASCMFVNNTTGSNLFVPRQE